MGSRTLHPCFMADFKVTLFKTVLMNSINRQSTPKEGFYRQITGIWELQKIKIFFLTTRFIRAFILNKKLIS